MRPATGGGDVTPGWSWGGWGGGVRQQRVRESAYKLVADSYSSILCRLCVPGTG